MEKICVKVCVEQNETATMFFFLKSSLVVKEYGRM